MLLGSTTQTPSDTVQGSVAYTTLLKLNYIMWDCTEEITQHLGCKITAAKKNILHCKLLSNCQLGKSFTITHFILKPKPNYVVCQCLEKNINYGYLKIIHEPAC